MGLVKEDHRGKVPFSPHHIKGTCLSTQFITVDVDLDHPAEVVLPAFSTIK